MSESGIRFTDVVWVVFFLSICFVHDVCHSGFGVFKSYGVSWCDTMVLCKITLLR